MNLRQIIQNQKLQNFDLISLVSEADEEVKYIDKEGKTKTMAIAPALRLVDPKHPARVAAEKLRGSQEDPKKKAAATTTSPNTTDTQDPEGKDFDDELDDFMGGDETKADIDDETRDNINQEMESQGLKPQPEDENTFVDEDGNNIFQIGADGKIIPSDGVENFEPDEEEGYAEYIEDLNDRLSGDDTNDKSIKADLKRATEDRSDEDIEAFTKEIFPQGSGISVGWSGEQGDVNNTPQGKPPSDAEARQTALDAGFPKKGTKPWPESEVTGKPAAPAPGNAGSMMNEVFSVEGCNIVEKYYQEYGEIPRINDLVKIMNQQYGDSQLASDNGNDNPESQNEYNKKLRIAALASVNKFERLRNGVANNEGKDPSFGTMIQPPDQFYGAGDSLEAQAEMIRDLPEGATIFGPDGPIKEITDNKRTEEELIGAIEAAAKKGQGKYGDFATGQGKTKTITDENRAEIEAEVKRMIKDNDVKQFAELLAYAGGGGANPSDTATFARSEEGNLMILFHSDKMSRDDQQANSTLGQEARRQEAYLNDLIESDQLSDEQKEQAQTALNEFVEVFERTSAADDSIDMAPVILGMMNDPNKEEALIAGLQRTAEENPKRILIVPRQHDESKKDFDKRKEAFLKQKPEDQRSPEQVKAFLQYFATPIGDPPDGRPPATGDQGKFFQKLKGHLGDDSGLSNEEIEKIDSTAIGAERTKEVVGAIQARLATLDEIKTKSGIPVGQYIETKNIIDKLHLYAMDDPSSLAYQSGMCATVIGNDVVNREVLREVFGVDSAEELMGKVKVGAAAAPDDDWVDESIPGGVKNSLIQRSTDTFVKTPDGEDVYFTVDENGKITGTTTDKSEAQMKGKPKKPVKVGVPTGQKSLFYAVRAHGEKCMFALQAARSKEGPGKPLQTAYSYGACMKEGIEKYGKESMQEESLKYKLSNIFAEAQENTLAHHWKIAEDDYPVDLFIKELNERSLN